jgi:hypothetical protein
MTIKQLRDLISTLPDDAKVVTSSFDHGYREVRFKFGTALRDKAGNWTEDYGEEDTPEAEFGKRVPVLLVI